MNDGIASREDRSHEGSLHLITLILHRDDGSSVDITLFRRPEWIEDYGAHVGGTVLLDLPEMAAVGSAEVLAIHESPRIDRRPGRLLVRHECMACRRATASGTAGFRRPNPACVTQPSLRHLGERQESCQSRKLVVSERYLEKDVTCRRLLS